MTIPQWDIFARIEDLENLKPTVNDAFFVAITAFINSFWLMANQTPKTARKLKDDFLSIFKDGVTRRVVSIETLNLLESYLIKICEAVEE